MIPALRTEGYKGCHVVYSGLSAAIQEHYGMDKSEARKFVDNAVKEGIIVGHPVKGGFMVYLPQDAPKGGNGLPRKAQDALKTLTKTK